MAKSVAYYPDGTIGSETDHRVLPAPIYGSDIVTSIVQTAGTTQIFPSDCIVYSVHAVSALTDAVSLVGLADELDTARNLTFPSSTPAGVLFNAPIGAHFRNGLSVVVTSNDVSKVVVTWEPTPVESSFPRVAATPARNAIPRANVNWQAWSKQQISGGTVTTSGTECTCTTNGGSSRAFIELGLNTMFQKFVNVPMVLSVTVTTDYESAGSNLVTIQGAGTLLAGGTTLGTGPYSAGKRYALRWICSSYSTPSIRIGIGTNATDNGTATVTFKDLTLEILDYNSMGPYCMPMLAGDAVLFTHMPGVSFTGTNSGEVSYKRNVTYTPYGKAAIVIGDSFSNDVGLMHQLNGDWPEQLTTRYRPDFAILNRATAGYTLAQLASEIDEYLSNGDTLGWQPYAVRPQYAFIEGGINDAFNTSAGTSVTTVNSMISSFKTIESALKSYGIRKICCLGMTPCSGFSSYDASRGVEAVIGNYTAWLRSYCHEQGYIFVDIHAAWRTYGATGALACPTVYNSGVDDGIHPNNRGKIRIAQLVAQAISDW